MKVIKEETLTAIGDAIRKAENTTEPVPVVDMASRVTGVYELGKEAEYNRFWDALQNKGKRSQYSMAFGYNLWNDEAYNPKYPIITNSCNQMFYKNTLITDTKVDIDISKGGQTYYIFQGATKLKTIRKLIVTEKSRVNTSTFQECTSLENIIMEGIYAKNGLSFENCSKLNKTSIISIINVLSTNTEGLLITFSKTSVNNAFETEEGKADGEASEEWLALVASKANWTISLV